jgi:hypothetical protein
MGKRDKKKKREKKKGNAVEKECTTSTPISSRFFSPHFFSPHFSHPFSHLAHSHLLLTSFKSLTPHHASSISLTTPFPHHLMLI